MQYSPSQQRVLQALVEDGTTRGMSSGEILNMTGPLPGGDNVELVLRELATLGVVESRDQTSEFWPSGYPAEAIPLSGGQIRSRMRYRAIGGERRGGGQVTMPNFREYYYGLDHMSVR